MQCVNNYLINLKVGPTYSDLGNQVKMKGRTEEISLYVFLHTPDDPRLD